VLVCSVEPWRSPSRSAGCSGGDDGGDGSAATLPPVTPTASPIEAAAEVPPEATEATPEGAAAFGRYFYETVDRSFKALDTTTLRAISDPDCRVCQRYIESIEGFVASEQRVEGNDLTVQDAGAPGERVRRRRPLSSTTPRRDG
jgi:hypothetical protein